MEKIKTPIRRYWNGRSSTYGLDLERSVSVSETWREVLNQLVSQSPGHRALDVGTGTGQFAIYLAQSGFDVTGIDLSERMVEKAIGNARREGLSIDFRTGDAECLDFEDDSFDVVVSRNLLWTLPNPEGALREWRRVLRPGGRLVVSDGFWMNITWRGVPRLAMKLVRDRFRETSRRSLHFFWSYTGIRRFLPYYSGLHEGDVTALLKKACFREVGCYDVSCFTEHPYRRTSCRKGPPPFFIAFAGK